MIGFCSNYSKSYSVLITIEKHCESKKETFTMKVIIPGLDIIE